MKPGDLVALMYSGEDFSCWLFSGEDKCWDDQGVLIPGNVPFDLGEVGVVLKMKWASPLNNQDCYVKLMTPRGVGWLYEDYLEVIGVSH